MRKLALIALTCGLLGVLDVSAQQTNETQFLSKIRVLVDAGSAFQSLMEPALRSRAGSTATVSIPDLEIRVTPEPLGSRVLLRVVAQSTGAQPTTVEFDVLSGPGVLTPMIALRSANGTWLRDGAGRPLFLQLQAETIQR